MSESAVAVRSIGSGYEVFGEQIGDASTTPLAGRLIALDTNALLGLYRVHWSSTENILAALRKIQDQLFLPAQVQREFWLNRDKVLREVMTANPTQGLATAETSVKKLIAEAARDIDSTERADLSRLVDETFTSLRQAIGVRSAASRARRALADPSSDAVLAALSEMFAGRTGAPFTLEEDERIRQQGLSRFARRQPPGYMDAAKADGGFGDYFLWEQLVAGAKTSGRPVVLVTNDLKEDWWRLLSKNAPISARFELVDEMRSRAGVDFRTLTLDQLLTALANDPTSELEESAIDDSGVGAAEVGETETPTETWEPHEFAAVVARLRELGYPRRADVMLAAAEVPTGVLDRSEVLSLLGWSLDAKMTGFTRAIRNVQRELADRAVIRPSLTWALSAEYDGPGKAQRFAVPPEIARASVHRPGPPDHSPLTA
ncbi:PIN domain-containing protein [Geodermatophilus sp. CPCC 205761]|uniref:PIN domain-containing protein n=1 Tax=Geodermatophilus sp. CPCC 205761 TaxID=2936597 RepID=UPI003EEA4CA0